MQTFPQPPRSYSLIENLRPSVSLSAETSQPDQNTNCQLKLRPEISKDLNQIIEVVQTSSVDDLKRTLKTEIRELEQLKIHEPSPSSHSLINQTESEDLVLSKLKQLTLISDILVQRMNEKYSESKGLFEEFHKQTVHQKRTIWCKIMIIQRKKNGMKERKIDLSQETEKKPMVFSEEKQEQVEMYDQKRTRKQETQGKGKLK